MRILTALTKMISLPLVMAGLVACSGGNSDAPALIDATGKHADNWVQQHWVAYKLANGGSSTASGATGCSECHGSDLSGGISKVSCFSATFNGTSCHANADRKLGHPTGWGDHISTGFHGYDGNGVKGNTDLARDCGLCHATDAAGSSVSSAPSCLSTDPRFAVACHVSSPAVEPSGCVSCHQIPSADNSSSQGAHYKHLQLSGVSCPSCHAAGVEVSGATATHATGTSAVQPVAAYNARSGVASYSNASGTCANVSCHGGKTTPSWTGGEIITATDCLSCHQQGLALQTPQYNSFFSGNIIDGRNEHVDHLARGAACTDCHSLTSVQHFGGLAGPAFAGPANTVVQATKFDSYINGTCNNVVCHSFAPKNVRWNKP